MEKIKLIISDLDGTLLTSQNCPSTETIEEIKRMKKRGILFGIATGRDIASVTAHWEAWGFEGLLDFMVASNGNETKDFILGTESVSDMLDKAYIKEVVDSYREMNLNYAIYENGKIKTNYENALIKKFSGLEGLPYFVVDESQLWECDATKLLIVISPQLMPVVKKHYDENLTGREYYGIQSGTYLFEFLNKDASKSNGLMRILEQHNLSMDNVLTFGDADNDAEMIKKSGVGVAMGNASERTKSCADAITEDNNHDGIAKFLRENFPDTLD